MGKIQCPKCRSKKNSKISLSLKNCSFEIIPIYRNVGDAIVAGASRRLIPQEHLKDRKNNANLEII
jgi:exopolysaccharide biosynthesis predicted pyruvyltransferase EpsI